jgi:uncharacterized OB-fold protein
MEKGFPRDFRNVKARSWHGNIPMGHKYTMGVAGEEFYTRLRDKGEITASLHDGGEQPILPPRLYDPDTLAPVSDWVTVGPGGEVDTFTVVTDDDGGTKVLALIRIDGAEGGLVHWIGGCELGDIEIGMRVKAVFEPKKKRSGALNDIRHFEPA